MNPCLQIYLYMRSDEKYIDKLKFCHDIKVGEPRNLGLDTSSEGLKI